MNIPRARRLPASTARSRSRVDRPVPRFIFSMSASAPAAKWRMVPNIELSWLSRFLLRFGRGVNVQTLHPVAERMPADFQLLGCTAHAETILLQRMHDQLTLEL